MIVYHILYDITLPARASRGKVFSWGKDPKNGCLGLGSDKSDQKIAGRSERGVGAGGGGRKLFRGEWGHRRHRGIGA